MKIKSKVYRVIEELYRHAREADEEVSAGIVGDITQREYTALEIVGAGGRQISSLAQRLGLSVNTCSELCERLESKRMIKKIHVADRRGVSIEITAEGRRTYDKFRKIDEAALERLSQALPKVDFTMLFAAIPLEGP